MAVISQVDSDRSANLEKLAATTETASNSEAIVTGALPSEAERLSSGIMRLMWINSKRLAQILAGYDLTAPQFYTLMSISRGGTACRMGDLAHRLYQSSATMTGIVTRLEADGLVERVMDPNDRRAVLVRVTERAKNLLDDVLELQRANVARSLERLATDDRQDLLRLLEVYLTAFTNVSG